MSDATSAPRTAPDGNTDARENAVVKLPGLELPLPRWARTPMGVVTVLAAPLFLAVSIYHMHADASASQALLRTQEDLRKTSTELKTAQNDLNLARDDYQEYVRHDGEQGSDFHRDPNLTVRYFESDGCIYVLRAGRDVWLRRPAIEPSPGRTPDDAGRGQRSELRDAATALITLAAYQQEPVRRGACLNPHPGKYTSYDGKKNGCWLQVWRKWSDGCQHYQWFNTCSSYWDIDAKGQPKVFWTSCIH